MNNKDQTSDIIEIDPIIPLPVAVARLKSLGEVVKAEADDAQREKLRDRLGILAVHSYNIKARVLPWKKHGVRIEGQVIADVEQQCVVSLKAVPEHVEEDFFVTLLPAGSSFAKRSDNKETGGEMVIDPEGEDPPEEFEGDEIDVGQYADEFFALALDDYPRAADVDFDGHIEDVDGPDSKENPFAALASLKDEMAKDPNK